MIDLWYAAFGIVYIIAINGKYLFICENDIIFQSGKYNVENISKHIIQSGQRNQQQTMYIHFVVLQMEVNENTK